MKNCLSDKGSWLPTPLQNLVCNSEGTFTTKLAIFPYYQPLTSKSEQSSSRDSWLNKQYAVSKWGITKWVATLRTLAANHHDHIDWQAARNCVNFSTVTVCLTVWMFRLYSCLLCSDFGHNFQGPTKPPLSTLFLWCLVYGGRVSTSVKWRHRLILFA